MPLAWGKKAGQVRAHPPLLSAQDPPARRDQAGGLPGQRHDPHGKRALRNVWDQPHHRAPGGHRAGAGRLALPRRQQGHLRGAPQDQAGFYQAPGNVQRADPPHGAQAQHRAVGHARRRHAPPAAQQLRRRWGRALCLPLPPPLRRRRAHRHGGNVSALRPLRLRRCV